MTSSGKTKLFAGMKDRAKRKNADAKKTKSKKSRHRGDNFYERKGG